MSVTALGLVTVKSGTSFPANVWQSTFNDNDNDNDNEK